MKLVQIFADVLGVPAAMLGDDASPATIETWDSVTALELISDMQEHYAITFTLEEIAEMRNLGDVRRVLRRKGAAV